MEFSIFYIGKPEWGLSYQKYVAFYISYTKIWVQIFVHEVWNLYFMVENLAVYVWSWYMEYCMFHIWIYGHTSSCMNREFGIIGKFEHTFSCWIMEFYFHKWIFQLNFLTRDMQFSIAQIWNSRSKYSFQKYEMCTSHKWKST